MISQFVSPISSNIYNEYDPGMRNRKDNTDKEAKPGDLQLETLLEHNEIKGLQGHVYMELLVHIY